MSEKKTNTKTLTMTEKVAAYKLLTELWFMDNYELVCERNNINVYASNKVYEFGILRFGIVVTQDIDNAVMGVSLYDLDGDTLMPVGVLDDTDLCANAVIAFGLKDPDIAHLLSVAVANELTEVANELMTE